MYPCKPLDCSPPGSSVHGILQGRILEWVAIVFFRGSSWPRDRTCVSCTRWVLYPCTTGEAPLCSPMSMEISILWHRENSPQQAFLPNAQRCVSGRRRAAALRSYLVMKTCKSVYQLVVRPSNISLLIQAACHQVFWYYSVQPRKRKGISISAEGSPPWGSKSSFFWTHHLKLAYSTNTVFRYMFSPNTKHKT